MADFSAAAGVRLSDFLAIGAGISYYYADATMRKMLAPGVLNSLTGDGTSWGGNVGVVYNLNENQRLAFTYRLPFKIDFDGQNSALGSSVPASASIDFPAVAVLAYSIEMNEKLLLEMNMDWTDWESVGDIAISVAGFPMPAQAQGLENTVAYKVGMAYEWSETIDLRCGYIRNSNATPDASWRPSLVDTDAHFFTAGIGFKLKDVTIDTGLQVVLNEDRTIDNNVDNNEDQFPSSSVDGAYETWGACVSASATYRF